MTRVHITMVTEELVSPVIGPVPPAQVRSLKTREQTLLEDIYFVGFVYFFCSSSDFECPENIPKVCASCFSGTGVEACTKCADGYLLEDWRCVSTCSSGYYLSEQTSDNGQVQRSCKK